VYVFIYIYIQDVYFTVARGFKLPPLQPSP